MKTVNLETLIGIMLIGILIFYGRVLAQTITRPIVDPGSGMAFRTEAGVDVNGKLIYHLPPPEVGATAVFLLRGETLRNDLAFWHGVQSRLPINAGVRLVGYCDGDLCASFVRGASPAPGFPVIVYAEAISSQGLINADAAGACVLLREEWYQPKKLFWRAPGRTPESIVKEILR